MASFKRHCLATLNNYIPLSKLIKSNTPLILMYHRIINPSDVPYPLEPGMYVTPKSFEMQIDFLNKNYKIVHLEEYIENYKNAKKNKLVALTFDDGWVDFYENAYPILSASNAPATVFLPTAFINTTNLFWTDKLAYYLANTDTTNLIKSFNFNDDLASIINKLKIDQIKRQDFMSALESLSSETTLKLKNLPSQFLSWEEVKVLSKSSLINFGSHSHLHQISTEPSLQELQNDLKESQNQLMRQNIKISKVFCYPNQIRSTQTDDVLARLDFQTSLGILNQNETSWQVSPNCFERIGVHEDISNNIDLFKLRLLGA